MNEDEKNQMLIEIFKRVLKDSRHMYLELDEDKLLLDGTIALTEEEAELLEEVLDE